MLFDFRKLNNINIISATSKNEVVAEHAANSIKFNAIQSIASNTNLLSVVGNSITFKVASIIK